MSRPLGTGISVNAHRPNPGVKSQLHTPLTTKLSDVSASHSASIPTGGAVKRETADHNPLLGVKTLHSSTTTSNSNSNPRATAGQTTSPADTHDALLQTFLTSCRVGPQNSFVPETVEGLKQVAEAGDWRSVVDMSGKLVTEGDFSTTGNNSLSDSLQLRFEGLFRMKLFDDLSLEISKVLNAEVSHMESSSHCGEVQSPGIYKIVSLTVLQCEIKSLTGRGGEALQQLYKLRTNLSIRSKSIGSSSDSAAIVYWWRMKIWNQIINILLRQRQWHLALHEMSQLLLEIRNLRDQVFHDNSSQNSNEGGQIGSNNSVLLRAEVVMLCRMSRLLLQDGAVMEATRYFDEAKALVLHNCGTSDPACYNHVALTEGLLLHVRSQYEDAAKMFELVMERINSSENMQVEEGVDTNISWGFFARPNYQKSEFSNECANALVWHVTGGITAYEGSILAAAVNNLASSLLYLRRIKDSISKLESLIQSDPVHNMTDPVVFNLTTMYDLSCAHELSGYKKKVLQSVAAIYHVYQLSYKSFRL